MQRVSYSTWSFAVVILCGLIAFVTNDASALEWQKHDTGNPNTQGQVIVPNLVGRCTVLFDGQTYRMWAGANYSGINIGHWTSTDCLNWAWQGIVLPKGRSGTRDDNVVNSPSVLYSPEPFVIENVSYHYRMWYSAHDGSRYRIFHAISQDGIEWQKYTTGGYAPASSSATSALPVFEASSSGWATYHVSEPSVIYHPDGFLVDNELRHYKLWYSGNTSSSSSYRIGLATSVDGVTWRRHEDNSGNPVPVLDVALGEWDDGVVLAPWVLHDGSTYHMWYMGGTSYHQIGYVTSSDGISWVRHRSSPALPVGHPGAWDDYRVGYPSVLAGAAQKRMWYLVEAGGPSGEPVPPGGIGYATSFQQLSLVATQCGVNPSAVAAGERISVSYGIHNPNSLAVTIGLGCSIRLAGTSDSWTDDSPNDAVVSVPPGDSVQTRFFDTPPFLPTGDYTVWYAIKNGSMLGSDIDSLQRDDLRIGMAAPILQPINPNPSLDGNFTISWSSVPGAESYELRWSTDPLLLSFDGSFTAYAATSYGAVDVTYGTYAYQVRALTDQVTSSWSGPQRVMVVGTTVTVLPIAKYKYKEFDGSKGMVLGSALTGFVGGVGGVQEVATHLLQHIPVWAVELLDLVLEPENVVMCVKYSGIPGSPVGNEDIIYLLEYDSWVSILSFVWHAYPTDVAENLTQSLTELLTPTPMDISIGIPIRLTYLQYEDTLDDAQLPDAAHIGIPIPPIVPDDRYYTDVPSEYKTVIQACYKMERGPVYLTSRFHTVGVVSGYSQVDDDLYMILKQYDLDLIAASSNVLNWLGGSIMSFVPVKVTDRGLYPRIGSVVHVEGTPERLDGSVIDQEPDPLSKELDQYLHPDVIDVLEGDEIPTYSTDAQLMVYHYGKDLGGLVTLEWAQVTATVECPVDIVITTPSGYQFVKTAPDEMSYTELDLNGDGEPDDRIRIGNPETGKYLIQVVSQPDAQLTERYSLRVSDSSEATVLVDDVPILATPSSGYSFELIAQSDETVSIVTPTLTYADVSPMSQIDYSDSVYNRRTGQVSMKATWTNTGDVTFAKPLHMVIDEIVPAEASVVNPDGFTDEGKPYYDYSNLVDDGQLNVGESSQPKPMRFINPTRARLSLRIVCLGMLNGEIPSAPSTRSLQAGQMHVVLPTTSGLAQNYPNPFNPETWIPYELAEASDVKVRIYDVQGRLVRTLNLGYLEIGQYLTRERAAYWDGRNDIGEMVGSGVYLYQIQAAGLLEARKMVVIR